MTIDKLKKMIKDKYGFTIVEQADLGTFNGKKVKGTIEGNQVIIRNDLNPIMKLVAIAHETGHLLSLRNKQTDNSYFQGSSLKCETEGWLYGLDIAIAWQIYNEYIEYWKKSLDNYS